MILPFSTKINGKPSYFVERIHAGLILNDLWPKLFEANFSNQDFSLEAFGEKHAKIHTIREDKNNRWKVGTRIDFFINVRQKNMFRFAPVLPVVSTQPIQIRWYYQKEYTVARIYINDKNTACGVWNKGFEDTPIFNGNKLLEFVNNDGFDTVDDFFKYFNKDFDGKIIHWTDKRY